MMKAIEFLSSIRGKVDSLFTKSFGRDKALPSKVAEKAASLKSVVVELMAEDSSLQKDPVKIDNFPYGGSTFEGFASLHGRGLDIKGVDIELNDATNGLEIGSQRVRVGENGEITDINLEGVAVDSVVLLNPSEDTAKLESIQLSKSVMGPEFTAFVAVKKDELSRIENPGSNYGPKISDITFWQSERVAKGQDIDQVEISLENWGPVDEKTSGKNCHFILKDEGDGTFALFARPLDKDLSEPDIQISREDKMMDKQGNILTLSARRSENGNIGVKIGFTQDKASSATTYGPKESNVFLTPVDLSSVVDRAEESMSEVKKRIS